MTKRMLIDATQTEETRVVLTSGTRVEDFDFEVSKRRPLKGNIYLAQVTRVEPSLQAAFVEYGGNRHGFLAFNEIHPDYYRIPMEDREALLAEHAEEEKNLKQLEIEEDLQITAGNSDPSTLLETEENSQEIETFSDGEETSSKMSEINPNDEEYRSNGENQTRKRRRYKIQEVIARRQIMLVQVVKEERGNKGAALSTFLSLAGRYCVLMPNTPRGGGVSRKIVSALDRKRLKHVVEGLNLPDGMAIIVRTAGSERTKTEIKRDYEYLIRLWDQIRESTLVSTAPYLVHEEANLIKRSIRDLYTRDINEILIEGEEGYKVAKSFMKTLMPSHARRVQKFDAGGVPLFTKLQVEPQLDYLYEPTVQLRSGGYIVLNQTEALVAVDVNSGRSTRERNIEETALKTNLEAAEEIARQLRLRDLAGLVVIDFIDMYENRNQQAIERKMKDVVKSDRARIQMSRISQFGLMELSRQRLRNSVMEASTRPCPHCSGTGLQRSIDSAALQVLRNIEEEGLKQEAEEIAIYVPAEVGFYLLNHKREILHEMEKRYEFQIFIEPDDKLIAPDHKIERTKAKAAENRISEMIAISEETRRETNRKRSKEGAVPEGERAMGNNKNRRRRYNKSSAKKVETTVEDSKTEEGMNENTDLNEAIADDDGMKKKTRRGKRGGRRRPKKVHENEASNSNEDKNITNQSLVSSEKPKRNLEEKNQGDSAPNGSLKPKPRKQQKTTQDVGKKPSLKKKTSTQKRAPKPKITKDTATKEEQKDDASGTRNGEEQNKKVVRINKQTETTITTDTSSPADSSPRQGWWSKDSN